VAVLPRREPAELDDVLPVFSSVAFASVAVLAVTGTYAAWRGIGSLHAIFGSTYGLLVVAKIVLFAALLALGNISRRLVRRRAVAYAMTDAALLDEDEAEADNADDADGVDDPVGHERLRRAVYVEALIGLVVLGFSAVLVAQPRGPEALAADNRAPISATAPLGGGRSVTVGVDPGTHGPVDVTVTLNGGARASTITATATQKSAEIGPVPVRLVRRGDAAYDGTVTLPVAGKWEIDLVVTTSTFDATTTDVTLELN
jgi:copper transport protein